MSRRQRQPSEPIAVGHRHAEIAAQRAASAKHEADERRYRLNPEQRPEPAPEPVTKPPRKVVFEKSAATPTPTPPAAVQPQTLRGGGRPKPSGSSAGHGADQRRAADALPRSSAPTPPARQPQTGPGGRALLRAEDYPELTANELAYIEGMARRTAAKKRAGRSTP